MKVGYIASLYPAPSHTFIQREILELEKLGIEVTRFSVRRSRPQDQLDDTARVEGNKTRSLLPLSPIYLIALAWLVLTRPLLGFSTLGLALRSAQGYRGKLMWCAYWFEAVLLAYWLDRERVEHLHCHFGNAGSNPAWLASRLAKANLSITFHGIDLDEPEAFRHRDKLVDATFAVCISSFGRSVLLKNINAADANKVCVVRCGFPVPALESIPPAPGRGEIISVARLSPEKGHLVLLEALKRLALIDVDFHCTLVGSGPLQGDLAREIRRLELDRYVTMAGAIPNEQVVKMIAASDISVLASYGEGIPIALLESVAWKRPFVATRVGGIPELAVDGSSGLLVEPGDAEGLAEALKRLIEDPALAGRLAAAGRVLVDAVHNPRRSAQQMLVLFKGLDGRRALADNLGDQSPSQKEKAYHHSP